VEVKPYCPSLGAEVRGVDLSRGRDAATYREVRDAFLKFGVLFFKEQSEIPPDMHIAIGRMFGDLHMHPAAPQMPGYPEVFVIHAHRDSKVANGEF
jgi:taurine dioxygenase